MGQRLIINVKGSDDRDFRFTTYFHWGAYTDSAISLTFKFIEVWERKYRRMKGLRQNDRLLLCAIEAWPGCGLVEGDANEIALVDAGFPRFAAANGGVPKGLDRNEGLIAVSEYEAERLIRWEDRRLDIHVGGGGALTFWTDAWVVDDLNNEDALDDEYVRQRLEKVVVRCVGPESDRIAYKIMNDDDLTLDELRFVGRLFQQARDNGWDVLFPNAGLLLGAIA